MPDGTEYRLSDLTRRLDEIDVERRQITENFRQRFHAHQSELGAVNLLCSQIPKLEARIVQLEQANFAVLNTKLEYLEDRVDTLAKGWWALSGSIILAAVTFALAVASGQI